MARTLKCKNVFGFSCYCRNSPMRKLILLLTLVVLPGAFAQENRLKKGTYAHFETSMGTFTALLETQLAPKTVANFTGLAQGTKDWKDPKTGDTWDGMNKMQAWLRQASSGNKRAAARGTIVLACARLSPATLRAPAGESAAFRCGAPPANGIETRRRSRQRYKLRVENPRCHAACGAWEATEDRRKKMPTRDAATIAWQHL